MEARWAALDSGLTFAPNIYRPRTGALRWHEQVVAQERALSASVVPSGSGQRARKGGVSIAAVCHSAALGPFLHPVSRQGVGSGEEGASGGREGYRQVIPAPLP